MHFVAKVNRPFEERVTGVRMAFLKAKVGVAEQFLSSVKFIKLS